MSFIQNITFLANCKSLQVQLRDCVAPWWTQIGVRLWDVESCTMSVSGSQCRDVKLAQRRSVVMSRCHDVMLAHNVTLLSLLFTLCIASDGRWACLWNSLFGRHHQILSDFAPTRHIDLVLTTTCSDSRDTSHWLLYQLNLLHKPELFYITFISYSTPTRKYCMSLFWSPVYKSPVYK